LNIYLNIVETFHPYTGETYYTIAQLYVKQCKLDTALVYYQKSLHSLVKDFSSTNIYVNPLIPKRFKNKEEREEFLKKINSLPLLLDVLEGKAEAFYEKWKMENGKWKMENGKEED